MRIRNGFVSNSSSSSFVINKSDLTEVQILQIIDYKNQAKILGLNCSVNDYDYWEISEDETFVYGQTPMDNFDMEEFLYKIGINSTFIQWKDF